MRYSAQIAAALDDIEPLDADDLLTFICDLEAHCGALRLQREKMTIEPELRCFDCERPWTAPMTVYQERYAPDNCPACYAGASKYAETFRYLDK